MGDTEKRITAKYILDTSGFNNSIKGVNNELKNNQSSLKAASADLKAFGSSSERLKSVQQELAKKIELQAKKVDIYKQSMEKATEKMNANISARDKLKAEIDMEKTKLEAAIQTYGKENEVTQNLRTKIEALTQEYNKKSQAVETNAKAVQNYDTQINKANADMIKTQGELQKINTKLAESNNKWLQASESLSKHSEKLKNVGEKVSGAGDSLLKISAPLVAAGAGALKVSADFEEGMSKVQAISGATGEDLSKLTEKAKEMGAKTKFSATESAEALQYMAMAGWKTDDMLAGLEGIMNLAAASGEDLGTTSDIVTDDLTAFGLSAKDSGHFADIMASASSNANTNVSLLGESFQYCASTCGAMGYSAEDASVVLGLMANAGIKGSQAGTTLKTALVNMVKPTDQMAAVMDKYGLTLTNTDGSMKSLHEVVDMLREKMGGLSEAEQSSAAAALFGKESMAGMLSVINASSSDYDKLTSAINNCDGSAKEMSDTMNNNTKGQLTLLKSQLEGVGIQLGQVLLPVVNDAIKSFSNMVDSFSKLSPETQENIIKMTAFGVAAGGALKVVGGGISTIGNIAGGISKLTGWLGKATVATEGVSAASAVAGGAGGLGALASSFGGVVVAAAPWIAAAGAVALAGYGIYEGLSQEVVPEVDLFADQVQYTSTTVSTAAGEMATNVQSGVIQISEATKEAVQSYLDMDEGAKTYLQDLYINGTVVTDSIVNESKAKFDDMKNTIIQGYEQQKNDSLTQLQDLFTQQGLLTDTEQAEILQKTTDFYTNKQTETQTYEDQIIQIIQTASDQKRELTSEEVQTITDLENQMRENAVKALSEQETESAVILQRIKDYDGRMTAEQASEHIKNLNSARDGAVQAAEDEYNKNIATITKMRDETGVITAEQADKMIEEAKRQRDETVQAAQETRDGAVEKIKDMNSNLEDSVDTSTGNILTWWDKLKRWWSGWTPERKNFDYNVKGTENVDENWTGNESFQGGLTTLHERGYELYDLPSKTRIYNHEASEDLVKKTAESVASKVANNIMQNNKGAGSKNITVKIPVILDGEEIARVTAPYIDEQLAFSAARG